LLSAFVFIPLSYTHLRLKSASRFLRRLHFIVIPAVVISAVRAGAISWSARNHPEYAEIRILIGHSLVSHWEKPGRKLRQNASRHKVCLSALMGFMENAGEQNWIKLDAISVISELCGWILPV
jgi:hypothetical protein